MSRNLFIGELIYAAIITIIITLTDNTGPK